MPGSRFVWGESRRDCFVWVESGTTALSGECQAETDLSGECQAMTALSGGGVGIQLLCLGESGYNHFVWGWGGVGGSFVLPQAASSIDWLSPCCPVDFPTYFSLDI